jgi:thioredoxin reductase (NADPH)
VTLVVPLALGGFAVLLMALVGAVNNRRARKKATTRAVTSGPRILIHDINDDRCTGCDACVAVCPTNVLDLVSNKSRVLRFQDCIQCEACMWACPTEALVMFPEGTKPPPLKVPDIDPDYQTRVQGQYLIGEVAGKPLVKNAANLGRAVVEHMIKNGLRAGQKRGAEGSDAKSVTVVDVAIVGSGPGGLSAALTCMQRGLSYVILEKEQQIASTIARYPKGKLVMAEPYDTTNLSLLPVFDSSKEQIIPIWKDVIEKTRLEVKLGEAVETVKRQENGTFDIRTTVAAYRAQRVVLATGTRGKPRTLQVPGENLPKVANLLDDPDEYRGKHVLVIGGGDSAVEAALALADAGAKVIISYRGKAFSRCAPKNKSAIDAYEKQNKLKVKLGSNVMQFEPESVILALADGSQKRYPNHAAFVLIGADPPIAWLEKLGVKFVEKPHQFQLGKSDDYVRRMVADARECPQSADAAAAQVRGEPLPIAPTSVSVPVAPPPSADERTGARKWLKSASAIFTQSKKLDQPMPLSEFAKRQRTHSGQGRRDQLSPGERTRVLRMLRDVGGRIADEESQTPRSRPSSTTASSRRRRRLPSCASSACPASSRRCSSRTSPHPSRR